MKRGRKLDSRCPFFRYVGANPWLAGLIAGVASAAGLVEVDAGESGEDGDGMQSGAEAGAGAGLAGDYLGVRSRSAEVGIGWSVDYTGEVLGNVTGGIDQGAVYTGLLALSSELDLGRAMGWEGAVLSGSALFPHGGSLSESYTGDLFVASNLDARHEFRLFELWVEDLLWEERLSVRVGQLAADSEFAGTEQGSLFVNATLGWPAILGVNVPAPAYPVGALGGRVAVDLGGRFDFRLACYNGDPDPADEAGDPENPHGFYYRWQDTFLISDFGTYWPGEDEEAGLAGSVRVGVWYHTGLFEHQRLDTTGRSLADSAGSGEPQLVRGNGGLYATLEQELTRETPEDGDSGQGLGVFGRVGWAPGDRNPVQVYVDGGVTYRGLIPGRDADVCGVALAYGGMSRDLRRLGRDAIAYGGGEVLPDYEVVIEGAYQLEVRSGWVLQGVVQYMVHPGGSAELDNALVLGVRTTLTL